MKVTQGDIFFHVLSPSQLLHIPQDIGNSYPLFGKVIVVETRLARKGGTLNLIFYQWMKITL
jgi:hypothetical protein